MAKKFTERSYIEGQLIAVFKDGVLLEEAEKIISSCGLSVINCITKILRITLFIAVPEGKEEEWKRELEKNDKVEVVSLNSIVKMPL